MDAQSTIKQQVTSHPVALYMKGTPQFPQCGFSATVVQILYACGVKDFFSVNVLEEPEIRQGIKEFANWPTIPQLYVNGEFVGGKGSDAMLEILPSNRGVVQLANCSFWGPCAIAAIIAGQGSAMPQRQLVWRLQRAQANQDTGDTTGRCRQRQHAQPFSFVAALLHP